MKLKGQGGGKAAATWLVSRLNLCGGSALASTSGIHQHRPAKHCCSASCFYSSSCVTSFSHLCKVDQNARCQGSVWHGAPRRGSCARNQMQGAKYKVKGAICKVSAKEQVDKVQGAPMWCQVPRSRLARCLTPRLMCKVPLCRPKCQVSRCRLATW